jgi:hypothetical protein
VNLTAPQHARTVVRAFAAAMAKAQRIEINEINHRRVALGLAAVPRQEIQQLERLHAPG